mmetsp:Transcript_33498/g.105519  ORF Transcript_33498/g.105519 Transcript_33498/m.105519 type:complete len:223 (+) Transcript_33498:114-782(+)
MASVVKYSFPLTRCKTVHFVRHAEATSNQAAKGLEGEARNAAYDDPRWFDARLSPEGEEQCNDLLASSKDISYSLVIISPLTRALQTLKLGLRVPEHTRIVALETARERKGLHPCDSRRSREILQAEYPDVDFSAVPEGEDKFMSNILGGSFDRRETNEELDSRIQETLSFIAGREEREILFVGHSSFFQRMFEAHIGWDCESYGPSWLENAELRTVNLVLR